MNSLNIVLHGSVALIACKIGFVMKYSSQHLQDIDTTIPSLTISTERLGVVDFPSTVFGAYSAILITTQQRDKFFVIQPVHYSVWILCCCLVIVISIYVHWFESYAISFRLKSSKRAVPSLYSISRMHFTMLLNQGNWYSNSDAIQMTWQLVSHCTKCEIFNNRSMSTYLWHGNI